jgi:FixJ family two-component response regulator
LVASPVSRYVRNSTELGYATVRLIFADRPRTTARKALPFRKKTLSDEGFEVDSFANAEDAMASLLQPGHPYQALLTDIRLPGRKDGWDVGVVLVLSRRQFR